MFNEKKRPHTFRQSNNWYMYNSMADRNPHRSTLITVDEITNRLQAIEANTTYKEYSARVDADFQSAYAASSNIKQHKKGFHRQVIVGSVSNTLPIATLIAGLFLGTLSGFSAFNKKQEAISTMNYLAFALACIAILISISKLFLDYNIQVTADKEERKKQHFKNMQGLKDRLPIVIQEIQYKEKVITALAKFFKKYNRSSKAYGKQVAAQNLSGSPDTLFNANQRDEIFENLALAFDRKDDLASYEKVFYSLTNLKNLSRLNEDTQLSNTLRLLIFGYLKGEFYENNSEYFESFKFSASIEDLISETSQNIRQPTSAHTADTENLPQANTLINVSQEEQTLAQNKAYDYFIDIMQDNYQLLAAQQLLKLAETNKWNVLDIIGVFASLNSTFINYKALTTNLEELVNSGLSYLNKLLQKIEGKDENEVLTRFDSLKEKEQAKLFEKLLKVLSKDDVIDKFVHHQNLFF